MKALLVSVMAVCFGCGGSVDGDRDASLSDASPDGPRDAASDADDASDACIRNEQKGLADRCCSHFSENAICKFHCSPRTIECTLPDAPCCADSGTCINGTCQ